MMRTTLTAAALSLIASGALLAQAPAPTPAPQAAPPPFQTLQVPTTVTTGTSVTGCLKPRDAGTITAPTATAGESAHAPVQYVLTNVAPAAPTASTTTALGAPVPPSGRTSVGAHATYLLQPSLFVDLAVHVNQQVQVTGAMASDVDPWFGAPRPSAPGASPAASATAPPAAQGGSIPATFIVSSITMIAKTCP